jgi:polyisoprenoid-binding protein YceI
MKRITKAALAASLITLSGTALVGFGLNNSGGAVETSVVESNNAAAGEYAVDIVHSNVLFKIRHGGLAYFYGHFDTFDGSISIDPDNIEGAKFNISVETGSVDTNNNSRDNHVRNADFFNARQYPKATFSSTGITETSSGVYELNGTFEFHGVTKPVSAKLTDISFGKQQGKDAIGFHAVFSISRSEFNITKYVNPDSPEDGPLGDTVEIIVSMEAVID